MYLSIDIAINVNTDTATDMNAMKLFNVQYTDPKIQFLQGNKVYNNSYIQLNNIMGAVNLRVY